MKGVRMWVLVIIILFIAGLEEHEEELKGE